MIRGGLFIGFSCALLMSAHWSYAQTMIEPSLKLDWKASETRPFVTLTAVEEPESLPSTQSIVPPSPAQQPAAPELLPADDFARPIATADASRERMRKAIISEAVESTVLQDTLTTDALKVAQWTGGVLLLGIIAVVILKQWGPRSLSQAPATQLKLKESLSLGGQRGLHLVEIGSERFIVAADQGGIKSVTLLPTWPSLEEAAQETNDLSIAESRLKVIA